MANRGYHGHFPSLSFPKKGRDIKTRVSKMLDEANAKIEERKKRIEAFAKEMKLDTSMDVLLNLQNLGGSYSNSGADITVGKSAAMRSEITAVQAETQEAERLKLIANNLPEDDTFQLNFEELEYFGF